MNIWKVVLRLGLAGLALLAGCVSAGGKSYNLYGIIPPPLPHEADVSLTDFSYTPASPIHVGDSITFRATLSRHTDAGYAVAVVKKPGVTSWACWDDGMGADAQAGDGVYTGELVWEAWRGTGNDLPVYAELTWEDGTAGPKLAGPPLTVLPPEEGQ